MYSVPLPLDVKWGGEGPERRRKWVREWRTCKDGGAGAQKEEAWKEMKGSGRVGVKRLWKQHKILLLRYAATHTRNSQGTGGSVLYVALSRQMDADLFAYMWLLEILRTDGRFRFNRRTKFRENSLSGEVLRRETARA